MPRILRPLHILVPTLLAVLAAGCESSTLSPESIRGTYVLVTYGGKSLPRETASLEDARYYVVSETLELAGDGTGTEIRTTRVDFRDPVREDRDEVTEMEFTYEVADDHLRFTYRCQTFPAAALDVVLPTTCAPRPHAIGRIEGDVMLVTIEDALLRYRRAG
jgi:hypothetical protein